MMDGASLVANAIERQGIQYAFGVVGIPIMEIAVAMQGVGIRYIGMRNEQSASYAASAIGYMTGRPAICLVVPGPGLIHALAGMANAKVNCWPLLVIAGSYDQDQGGMGAFQEWPQLESCQLYTKYSVRVETMESIPFHIEKAVRMSTFGRPGPCYVEIPGNMITSSVKVEEKMFVSKCPAPPHLFADPHAVKQAVAALHAAKKPLVIIGKGVAYAKAEDETQRLVLSHSLPFLPTPMGKGVISDEHPYCVAAARSMALKEADTILLLGARLNWILHFGQPPRFHEDVKILQVDICAEEMNSNVKSHVMLCGDIKAVLNQLNKELEEQSYFACNQDGSWWRSLSAKVDENLRLNMSLAADESLPMSFYCAYNVINRFLPRDAVIVNEGSSTMDIGRTVLLSHYPRQRLDAGTFGTMGVGCGFAIAAALLNQSKSVMERRSVYCIQGDSAFGFSGMEFETACRYKLPIIFIIMNNNGIYRGLDKEAWNEVLQAKDLTLSIPPTSLLTNAHYDKMAMAFGAHGYHAATPAQLYQCLASAHKSMMMPSIINVEISPSSARKPQEHSWLTRSKL
eukprot:Em0007g969a